MSTQAQLAHRRASNRERVRRRAQELGEFTLGELWQDLQYVPYQSVATACLALWRDGFLERQDRDGVWVPGRYFLAPPRTHVARYRVH